MRKPTLDAENRFRREQNASSMHQNSRHVCPAVVAAHAGAVTHSITRQSSTFARPVVPDCISNHFRLLSAMFWLLSAFFLLFWQSVLFVLNFFRLFCAFSDWSGSRFRLLSNFSDCSALFSDCSVPFFRLLSNFSGCSGSRFWLPGAFPIALAVVSKFWTSYFICYVIHLNLTTRSLVTTINYNYVNFIYSS